MILNHGMIYGITALTGYTTRARAMAEAKRLSRALVEHPRRTTTKAGVGPKGAVGAPPLSEPRERSTQPPSGAGRIQWASAHPPTSRVREHPRRTTTKAGVGPKMGP